MDDNEKPKADISLAKKTGHLALAKNIGPNLRNLRIAAWFEPLDRLGYHLTRRKSEG